MSSQHAWNQTLGAGVVTSQEKTSQQLLPSHFIPRASGFNPLNEIDHGTVCPPTPNRNDDQQHHNNKRRKVEKDNPWTSEEPARRPGPSARRTPALISHHEQNKCVEPVGKMSRHQAESNAQPYHQSTATKAAHCHQTTMMKLDRYGLRSETDDTAPPTRPRVKNCGGTSSELQTSDIVDTEYDEDYKAQAITAVRSSAHSTAADGSSSAQYSGSAGDARIQTEVFEEAATGPESYFDDDLEDALLEADAAAYSARLQGHAQNICQITLTGHPPSQRDLTPGKQQNRLRGNWNDNSVALFPSTTSDIFAFMPTDCHATQATSLVSALSHDLQGRCRGRGLRAQALTRRQDDEVEIDHWQPNRSDLAKFLADNVDDIFAPVNDQDAYDLIDAVEQATAAHTAKLSSDPPSPAPRLRWNSPRYFGHGSGLPSSKHRHSSPVISSSPSEDNNNINTTATALLQPSPPSVQIPERTQDGDACPFVRSSPFPMKVKDRSTIQGLSSSRCLRVCFRIGEAIRAASSASKENLIVVIELYARIVASKRKNDKQCFTLGDLFTFSRPPYLEANWQEWKSNDVWQKDADALLAKPNTICRVLGQMDKCLTGKWILAVMSAWQVGWDEIDTVRGIVCAQ